jgi:hypothetical protein
MGTQHDRQMVGRLSQAFINTYINDHPVPSGCQRWSNMTLSGEQTIEDFNKKVLGLARQGIHVGPAHSMDGRDKKGAPSPRMTVGLYQDPNPSYHGS